ncbi:ABC transporter permease [Brevibacterium sp. RIT 803]|uniref:ABC transporter permease n=1 Tax=Brevibacterium sp. RIT 803 TaxID=2810210 RepID=UPI00194FA238|nr:ABC transporter permease [Brevibacterium sp. RIT 803]MBM6588619.1 ABC transporter permease [Brevibacterium sp. RIT 803]
MTGAAATTSAPVRRSTSVRTWIAAYGVYLALALLVVVNVIITPHFLTVSNLRLQLIQTAPVLIVALGMAMVIGTKGIDLSVGSVMALSAAVMPLYIGYGTMPAIIVGIVAGGLSGLMIGLLVSHFGLQPIVATLAVLIGGRGLANVIGGEIKNLSDPGLAVLGTGSMLGVPYSVLSAIVFVILVGFLMRRTSFGVMIEAIGGNKRAAELAGIRIKSVLVTVYVLSGLLAAFAGILVAARSQASDPRTLGLLMELSAIAAVVIGGTSLGGGRVRVLGTVGGALLMQLIVSTLVSHNVADSISQMVQAVVIVVAVALQVGRRRT